MHIYTNNSGHNRVRNARLLFTNVASDVVQPFLP